jgi:5-methyltetrahydrofolate--homocysteine methyltransferase
LVKSTLVMRDNLEELARRGLGHLPVMLGGAALNRSFVEDDLRPRYPGPLFYCKDAFAGLEAMESIVVARRGGGPVPHPPARVRPARRAVPAGPAEIPARRTEPVPVFVPPFLGSRVVTDVPLGEVVPYLDHTALFRKDWRFRPEAGEDPAAFRARLEPILQARLAEVGPRVQPAVAYGFFAAGREGNDLVVWGRPERSDVLARFRFPRQPQAPFHCLADYWRSADEGEDYAAFQVVTIGEEFAGYTAGLLAAGHYSDYFLDHGLGAALAEALAEAWHARVREEWGFGHEDAPTPEGVLQLHHRGLRYSWGYPACPDLEDNAVAAALVGAERIGVHCGPDTGFQYHPELTTSALVTHHPDAVYFAVHGGGD